MKYNYALVRPPGENYIQALSSTNQSKDVDLEKLFWQHQQYCQVLNELGLTIIKLPVELKYPDGCFVEDAGVIYGDSALVTIPGALSRKGEGKNIYKVLKYFKKIKKMVQPATMDGGDVIITPDKVFIGLSSRTNLAGVEQFEALLKEEGLPKVIGVPVMRGLHLKTSASYIGGNTMVASLVITKKYFDGFNLVTVSEEESYGANCLNVNGVILVAKGYRSAVKGIKAKGFEVVELEMSEFKKADGSITCLSLLF